MCIIDRFFCWHLKSCHWFVCYLSLIYIPPNSLAFLNKRSVLVPGFPTSLKHVSPSTRHMTITDGLSRISLDFPRVVLVLPTIALTTLKTDDVLAEKMVGQYFSDLQEIVDRSVQFVARRNCVKRLVTRCVRYFCEKDMFYQHIWLFLIYN